MAGGQAIGRTTVCYVTAIWPRRCPFFHSAASVGVSPLFRKRSILARWFVTNATLERNRQAHVHQPCVIFACLNSEPTEFHSQRRMRGQEHVCSDTAESKLKICNVV